MKTLIIIITLATLVSCSKKEEPAPVTPAPTTKEFKATVEIKGKGSATLMIQNGKVLSVKSATHFTTGPQVLLYYMAKGDTANLSYGLSNENNDITIKVEYNGSVETLTQVGPGSKFKTYFNP